MNVDSILTVSISELRPRQWEKLERKLTYLKDDGNVVQNYRRLITKGIYKIPRGAWSLMPDSIEYWDNRSCPKLPTLKFIPKLDDVEKDPRFEKQRDAMAAMFEHEQGLIIRPPGTGKSHIALAFAARCKTRTLVLVHTEDILRQWVMYVEEAIPELKGKVGIIRGTKCVIGHITIATVQTLSRSYVEKPKSWWRQWGCIIADEAHHVPAPTWESVLNTCPARYRFGFTATDSRADGNHPSMQLIVGPVIHRMKFTSPVKLEVVPVKTDFKFLYRGPFDWKHLLDALVTDDERNGKVAEIAREEIGRGNSILILSRRIEHLQRIAGLVGGECEILTGNRGRLDRARILEDFRAGRIRCLCATQLADEALDVPRLNRVVLCHPGKHEGRIIQQIGRALRRHPEKEDALIYDVIDNRVGVLRRQWDQRKRTYRANRISIRSTGSLLARFR